jgi:predicted transposase YdaD
MFDIPDPTGRRGSLHDQVFKDLIRTFLPDFLTLVAPEPAGRLDLSRWTLLDKETFTDWPKGRRRELDLLAEVPFADGSGRTALIHVEIEARSRREIGPRLAGYYMQTRLRHGRTVLPFAVCLRRGRPGVHLDVVVDDELGPEIGCFHYYCFGLERSRAEDYLAKDQPLAWALAALMRSETLSRAQHKMACLKKIAAAHLDELRSFLLGNCVETYLQLNGQDAEELEALQANGNAEEVRVMRMTWAEQLKQEGRETGVVMGVEMGKREGLEQGVRQTLLRQLGARFGPLSDDVKRRVEAIRSVERLNQMAEQILVARSLEEMGLL